MSADFLRFEEGGDGKQIVVITLPVNPGLSKSGKSVNLVSTGGFLTTMVGGRRVSLSPTVVCGPKDEWKHLLGPRDWDEDEFLSDGVDDVGPAGGSAQNPTEGA